MWDPASERRRVHHALIITLVYSRHQYVYVTPSQKIPDLIAGLEEAWAFFGGVPVRVVLDNLKAAVTKADRYDPIFQRTFAEYAQYRGFVIDAAVPRSPTGKPVVERGVQYLRESFFRGETWLDRNHVQREAIRWCLEMAGQRGFSMAIADTNAPPAFLQRRRRRRCSVAPRARASGTANRSLRKG